MMPFFSDKNIINTLYKPLLVAGLLLFILQILSPNLHLDPPPLKNNLAESVRNAPPPVYDLNSNIPTNISHIVIAITSTVKTFKSRKSYIESWWRPNVTKGYLFLDLQPKEFLPWSPTFPPYRIYEDTLRYKPYNKHPMKDVIRMARVVLEAFRQGHQGVRWYVVTDDDTLLFLDNLVDVLSGYDHTKYFYIGESSEAVQSNVYHSFEMAFGGGGYAVSYPLAEALVNNLDVCIKRYPSLYGSDHIIQSCVADLGVSLTHHKGFHQIDLRKNISGFLSALPQYPLVSLHHMDAVDPLFPSMSRVESVSHLMKAARVDQSRLLQQAICYGGPRTNWSFSVSWGYSAQVYETFIPPSVLEKPLETFSPWRKDRRRAYMFNTRWVSNNPCEMPHYFYLESVEQIAGKNEIVTVYARQSPRRMKPCASGTQNQTSSALVSDIQKIIVVSPASPYSSLGGSRRECCDVLAQVQTNVTQIKYRSCMKHEITGVD